MPPFEFVLAGRYKLVAPLGEGGMASVYRGRDLRLNRDVAVKILRDDLTRDPEFLARFDREAQVVASLSHPNIVPVYDVGDEQGSHFIVMEYVRGRTLKDALDARGPMAPEQAVGVMLSILDALGYAHDRGLVHRDVKPQNILLTPDGTARLADFGIVRLADGSTTRTAVILGSAHYLSPEQARGEEATPRSDIYACGIVLYEMLAGHPPFDGPNALVIANQHLHSTPEPLEGAASGVPRALSQAVAGALAKDPNARFASTEEFSEALRTGLPAGAATTVQPVSPDATQPLVPDSAPSSHGSARRVGLGPDEMVLRRSARKTAVLAVMGAVAVVLAASAAGRQYWGHTLPAYPSLPYMALPAALATALALWWFSIRSWRYTMDTDAAVVRWGLVTHRRFGVPVRYIATLELKQSPIDRVLGVGTVELCARDDQGRERRLVLEDLPHPQRTYEELMRFVGRAVRTRAVDVS